MANSAEENGPSEVEKFRVSEGESGRLDRWLSERFPEVSRSHWQKVIRGGKVTVDEKLSTPRETIQPGRIVEVSVDAWPDDSSDDSPPEPQELPLDVLFEDEHLLVINKAPGMVVHPGNGCRDGTVVNAALYRCGTLPDLGDPLRPGIVHRLDKETSGVLVVAKSEEGGEGLAAQFRDRDMEKTYWAVIQGVPDVDGGTCRGKIGRHPIRRTRMAVIDEGRNAVSHWTLKGECKEENWSVVRVRIETGRTHQIRVHLSHEGFPIVGDSLYGYRRNRSGGLSAEVQRVLLHAGTLRFSHPVSGEDLTIEAPIPGDMLPFWRVVS